MLDREIDMQRPITAVPFCSIVETHQQFINGGYGWKNIEEFLQSTIPTNENQGCFEASAFTRDLPILPEKLKPLLDQNIESIYAAIKMNLEAEGFKTTDVEDQATLIFTLYCGLGVLALYESQAELQKRVNVSISQLKKIKPQE